MTISRRILGLNSLVRRKPLVFNSLVYGFLYTGAEFAQQTYNKKFHSEQPVLKPALAIVTEMEARGPPTEWAQKLTRTLGLSQDADNKPPGEYNWPQLKRYAIYGCFLAGPILHGWMLGFCVHFHLIKYSAPIKFELPRSTITGTFPMTTSPKEKGNRSRSLLSPDIVNGVNVPLVYKKRRSDHQPYDWIAIARYTFLGTLVYPPIYYYWYHWLDTVYRGQTKIIVLKKLIADQFVLTPPLVALFFVSMSLMEGKKDIFHECRVKFLTTFMTSCMYWIPIQLLNFMLVPPTLRVLYVGVAAFCWVNILCYLKGQPSPKEQESEKWPSL